MTYYVQTNVVCLLLLGILFINILRTKEKTTDQKVFHMFVVATMWFCVADLFTWVFDGVPGTGARIMLYMSDMAYFISSTLCGFLWLAYVLEKTGVRRGEKHIFRHLAVIPVALFGVLVLLTPVLPLVFEISPDNVYSRGSCIWLHWVVSWTYMLGPSILAIILAIRSKDRTRRRELAPLMSFVVFPLVASVLQVLFYGTSILQVGMTISVLLVFIAQENTHAMQDGLTGVYNRRYLDYYLSEKLLDMPKSEEIFMLMVDVDDFKQINDAFGHVSGDIALREIGYALQIATQKRKNVFAARYGGDEFVIFGYGKSNAQKYVIVEEIQQELERWNATSKDFKLILSIGCVSGKVEDFPNSDILLAEADSQMYAMKNRRK